MEVNHYVTNKAQVVKCRKIEKITKLQKEEERSSTEAREVIIGAVQCMRRGGQQGTLTLVANIPNCHLPALELGGIAGGTGWPLRVRLPGSKATLFVRKLGLYHH